MVAQCVGEVGGSEGAEVRELIDLAVGASPHPILLNPYGVEPQQIKPCKGRHKLAEGLAPMKEGHHQHQVL